MLSYSLLLKELDNIKNCYFIYSYDLKLVLNFIRKLESRIIVNEFKQFNFINLRFDSNFNMDSLFEACDTMPIMQDKKIVVLENALFLRRDYDNKDLVVKFKDYIKNLPEYCIFIAYYNFQEQDKNKDSLNSFSNLGKVCKIQELKDDEFHREVSSIFRSNNVRIRLDLIKFFCSRVTNDFFHIENEIMKLKFFSDGREVTKKDIEDVVLKSFEHNIFTFINVVLNKNLKSSLRLLKELINSGKDINYILSMLSNQFLKFLDIKIMLSSGMRIQEIMKKTSINKYVLDNFVKLSNKYSISDLSYVIDQFLDIEYRIRNLNNVDLVNEVEGFILRVCLKKTQT